MVKERKCFVLMPFKKEFNNPWYFAVKPAAESSGLIPYRADDESRPMGKITRDITKSIIDADLIIAEMTGLSPNVLYELGLAHAAKKRVIMITQKSQEIPFDIHDIRHIPYDINELDELKEKLATKIRVMLDIPEGGDHDFFPELQVMMEKEKSEIKRLKIENSELASLANGVKISTSPKFAYIFFNNRYIGIAPQTIHVNPYNEENILTVFALEHFEEYRILAEKDLKAGCLHIDLEKRDPRLYPKRVHHWLKYIRKQPNDVVIGRAIANYLNHIGEHEEAVKQLKELLKTCDNWSMLYNGIACCLIDLGKKEEALGYYMKVKELEDSYISFFNLACVYSETKEFEKSLVEMNALIDRNELVEEMFVIHGNNGFDNDHDFDNIRNDPEYGPKFEELNCRYKEKAKSLQTKS